jgi:adenylate cyclase
MQRVKRRLAAIMCADVAQYSRLMERDEDGTLDRLKAYRSVMSALTEGHNGRIVNTWGDAVIIEFSSVTKPSSAPSISRTNCPCAMPSCPT